MDMYELIGNSVHCYFSRVQTFSNFDCFDEITYRVLEGTTTHFKMKGDVKIERLAKLNNIPGIMWSLFSNRKFEVCLLFVDWYYHAMTKQIPEKQVSAGPNCVYHTGFINCKKSHECFQDENVVRFRTFALTWRREANCTCSQKCFLSWHPETLVLGYSPWLGAKHHSFRFMYR